MRKVGTLACLISSVMGINAQIIEAGESNPVWGVRVAFDVNLPGKVHGNVIFNNTLCEKFFFIF